MPVSAQTTQILADRLIDQSRVDWQSRAHFFAVAAEMIRRVLVDHARQHHAASAAPGPPSRR